MNDLISVIIPVYNRKRFLPRCLNSLIYRDGVEKEIIVVDDGSTDGSAGAAEEILSKSGVSHKVIRFEKNRGLPVARNAGIRAASGVFVSFVDSDDCCDKDAYSLLTARIASGGERPDMVFCGYRSLYEDGSEKKFPLDAGFINDASTAELLTARLYNKIEPCLASLFRLKFLIENNIFFYEKCRAGEDGEFMLKAISRSKKRTAIEGTPYIYIHHDEMGSNEQDAAKRIMRYEENAKALKRSARDLLKNVKDAAVRDRVKYYLLPLVEQKKISLAAMSGDEARFMRLVENRIRRQRLLSSYRMTLEKPEIFLKSLWLLAFPNGYYRHYFMKYKKT